MENRYDQRLIQLKQKKEKLEQKIAEEKARLHSLEEEIKQADKKEFENWAAVLRKRLQENGISACDDTAINKMISMLKTTEESGQKALLEPEPKVIQSTEITSNEDNSDF